MCLDMYLKAKLYASAYTNKEVYEQVARACEGMDPDNGSVDLNYVVGYWRKANAIHGWFVDNIQDGMDECQETYVSRETLAELKDLCEKVLADESKAKDLLPPRDGFFFGSTTIDEWYRADLKLTIEILERAFNSVPETTKFYYQSSW